VNVLVTKNTRITN